MKPLESRRDELESRLGSIADRSENALAQASVDFGGSTVRRPGLIVRPGDADELAAVISAARAMRTTVAVRGAGHSQGGQGLSDGGLVVDTLQLCELEEIDELEGWAVVGAGMRWGELLQQTLPRGLAPPVLTDNLDVTIGGTLAVGGVGPSSFRRGLQTHHCLGLEVVLGTGEVCWTAPDRHPRLFHSVLGGMGRLGIVTRAKVRLERFRPYVQRVSLIYDETATFLETAAKSTGREDLDYVEGFGFPVAAGPWGGIRYRFGLELARQTTARDHTEGLASDSDPPAAERQEHTSTTEEFLLRWSEEFSGFRRPAEKDRAHPWVEHFLPMGEVERYLERAVAAYPAGSLLLWPLQTEPLAHPMLSLPAARQLMLVGLLNSVDKGDLPAALEALQEASDLGIRLGGKRYLSGWVRFDPARWRNHFGADRWSTIMQMRESCDPDRLFGCLDSLF